MKAFIIVLLASIGFAVADDVKVRIVRDGTNVVAEPGRVPIIANNAVWLLRSCSTNSTAYAVQTNTWKEKLGSKCLVHLTWTQPTKIRVMDSSNKDWEERAVDEILVPLPSGKWPDHFFVKSGVKVFSFTRYAPNYLKTFVSEPALQLSSEAPYASLIRNKAPFRFE